MPLCKFKNSADLIFDFWFFNPGFIGKIVLQIPVRHIKSEPCVISIDSLYLVAGPAVKASYDEEKENQAKQQSTKQQLEALESQWKVSPQKVVYKVLS